MADAIWLDVLPALDTFSNQLTSGAVKASKTAGKASGSAWSQAFGNSAKDDSAKKLSDALIENEKRAKKAVEDATTAIGMARSTQREAAARTLLAEDRLADAIKKHGEDSAKAQAAALRLESARDKQKVAANKVERAELQVKAASNEAREATEQLARATKQAGDKVEKTEGAWASVKKQVGGFKDSLKDAETNIGGFIATAGGAIGAAAIWTNAWDDAMSLNSSTSKFEASLGLTKQQSALAGEAAGSLFAAGYGDSIGEVTSATEAVISSIKGMREASAAEIEEITGKAMSLAGAFDVDVQDATRSAAQLINQGLAPDATAAFDLIAASLQQVPTALRGEVLDATHEYSQFFGQMGFTGAEAMGALTKAAEDGQYGIDKMGDSIKEFVTFTGSDMPRIAPVFEDLGLNAEDMADKFLAGGDTAREAFGVVVGELQKIKDPSEQAAAAVALFGTPLEDMNVGEIPEFLESLASMDASLGDVKGKSEEVNQAMAESVDPIDSVKRSFMGILTEALEPLAGPLEAFQQWAKDNPGLMQGVAIAFGVLSVALGVATIAWGAMTIAASPWIITAAIIAAAIAAAVAIIVAVVKNWGDITEWLGDITQKVGDWIGDVWDSITEAISKAWESVRKALKKGWDWIYENVVMGYINAWETVGEAFKKIKEKISSAWESVRKALKKGWDWIYENVVMGYINAWNGLKDVFFSVKDGIVSAWDKVQNGLKKGWDWISDKVFSPMKKGVKAIGETFEKTKDFIGKAWDKIKKPAAKPVNFVIETVYTKGIKNVWDKIASKVGLNLKLPSVKPIKFASGGVLPGYTPGRDVHEFYSPTAGRLSLSGGEAIMRPEFTRAMGGAAGIARLNRQAIAGSMPHQAFFLGGVWDRVQSGAKSAWNWSSDKAGAAWDWTKNTAESVANFVSDPIAAIADIIGKPVQSMLAKVGAGVAGDVVKQVPGTFLTSLGDWAKKAVSGRDTEGAPSGPGAASGIAAAMGWQAMVKILKTRFPDIAITSTVRPGAITAVGTPSMHGAGRAVDMSPRMDVFNWLASMYPNSRELIYSPAGKRQLLNGRQHYYGGVTRDMHFNHVHWAMAGGGVLPKDLNFGTYDTGGVLPPGDTLVSNKTGRPELVLNPQQIASLGQPHGPQDLSTRTIDRLAHRIAEELGLVGDMVREVKDAVGGALNAERMA